MKNETSSMKSEQPEVNLPGWKNIANKKKPFCLRVFWIAAVLVSMVACSFQILERVNHFKKSKISVALNVDVDAQLSLPHIVVCQNFNDFQVENATILDAVKLRINETAIISNLKDAFKITPNIYKMKYHQSLKGKCIIFQYDKTLNVTPAALAEIQFIRDENLKICFMELYSVSIHGTTIVNEHDLLHTATTFDMCRYLQFSIAVRKYLVLNTTDNMCGSSDHFYHCRKKCVDKLLAKSMSCRLPVLVENTALPVCQNVTELMIAQNEAYKSLIAHNWADCSCVRPCKLTRFESTYHSFPYNNLSNMIINVNFKDSQLQTIREYQSYTQISFICDLGGTLGLFLGFCLLSALEIVDAMYFNARSTSLTEVHSKKAWAKIKH